MHKQLGTRVAFFQVPFPFPWESHGSHGNPMTSISVYTSRAGRRGRPNATGGSWIEPSSCRRIRPPAMRLRCRDLAP